MSLGLPLTDQDRYPWLNAIHKHIQSWFQQGQSGIVTCSALKRSYRDILRHGLLDKDLLLGSPVIQADAAQSTDEGSQDPWQSSADKPGVTVQEQQDNVNDQQLSPLGNKHDETQIETKAEYSEPKTEIQFVHLKGSREMLENRLKGRLGHFMPATLLQSQLDTLQDLQDDETGIAVDVNSTVENITQEIIQRLNICDSSDEQGKLITSEVFESGKVTK